MKKNRLTLYFWIFLSALCQITLAQSVTWNQDLPGTYNDTIKIPASTVLQLPTSNAFVIGVFAVDDNTSVLTPVGAVNYNPSIDTKFQVKVNNPGLNQLGYNTGEKFITLILDQTTSITYAVEFNYINNDNTFKNQLTACHTVTGIKSKTWGDILNTKTICKSTNSQFTIDAPYGVSPSYTFTNGLITSSNNTIDLEKTPAGNHTVNVSLNSDIKYQYYSQNFDIKANCNSTLTEETHNLLMNPYSTDNSKSIYFDKNEEISIYDKNGNEIIVIKAPYEWDGKDKYGSVLPVGIYFIYHSSGQKETISIIY
jgi:hypothetical protein